jgi:D-alanine-D-alanine ligase
MKVTVLYGGPSAEREVSLISGKAVIEGLRSMGHDVFPSDVSPTDLSGLDKPADVIFPVLHGEFGESASSRRSSSSASCPFVGSGSKASKIGIDKVDTKREWEKAGLPTPAYEIVTRENKRASKIAAPAVVKAFGSWQQHRRVRLQDAGRRRQGHRYRRRQAWRGPRRAVHQGAGADGRAAGGKPLAPIRIVPKSEFFDYEAKYKSKETEHRFDTGLPADVVKRCQELAKKANDVVGARDLARIDIMLDGSNNPYLLEINTLPGFTPVSLLPEAAKHAGIEFGPLVDRLVKRAAARGAA